jgi:hypothetical protein
MLDSDPEDEPVAPPRPRMRTPSPTPPPSPPRVRKLSPLPQEAPVRPADWGALLTRMKPDAPKAALKKRPPAPPPPAPKKEAPSSERRAWLPREEWLASKRRQDVGDNGFDIRVHGYWLTRARGLVYRCPDGRELPATGADAFDP